MLIEFTVGNYLSFKEPITLSLIASSDKELIEENTFKISNKIRLLKNIVIYGPNSSGKSNLLKAMKFFKNFILKPRDINTSIPISLNRFKLSTETEDQPSFFEISFSHLNTIYRYGFEITEEEVKKEWLYASFTNRESKLFFRDINHYEIGNKFKEGKGLLKYKTRKDTLFLPVVAQFNGKISMEILNWFKKLNVIPSGWDFGGITVDLFEDKKKKYRDKGFNTKNIIINLLKIADSGINNIIIRDIEKDYKGKMKLAYNKLFRMILEKESKKFLETFILTMHKKFNKKNLPISNVEFNLLNEESEGTKKYFNLLGPVIDTLLSGKILFIDELESSLHYLIVEELVKIFNSKFSNKNNSQFIFTTHNINLLNLDIFRRDQLYFLEKDDFGKTDISSLMDFKKGSVRKDLSLPKNYIMGKFGSIPLIKESFEDIFKKMIDEQKQKKKK